MANFCEEIGQNVTHLVVPNDGESPCGVRKGMADSEGGATGTFCWQVRGHPVVTQAESISESTLMESKAMHVCIKVVPSASLMPPSRWPAWQCAVDVGEVVLQLRGLVFCFFCSFSPQGLLDGMLLFKSLAQVF